MSNGSPAALHKKRFFPACGPASLDERVRYWYSFGTAIITLKSSYIRVLFLK
ncbi:hypothetical protein ANAPH1_00600 [Anaplasma phagocytophilum]|nr:hypothetical protein ANAPH1_00600 [Anaplasma phagocytophilum]SCV64858.1 hypothetical protein ANAPH2_01091 [Anaplasma phagocytophilum]SCV65902.1 hypothetical protein ANAPH2_01416 [Anaplasma phagocytophilum]